MSPDNAETLTPERSELRQRMDDWLMHAKGNRRRAHEYKRWAAEAESAGNLKTYRHFRRQAERSWQMARSALANARIFQEIAR